MAACSYIASFMAGATISGRAARQRGGGEQVVGGAVGELGERVGRRRRDQEEVGALDQREVRERGVLGRRVAREGAAQRVAAPTP